MAETKSPFALAVSLGLGIVAQIKAEFASKHLSMNLVNTMKVYISGSEVRIVIPAQVYDMGLFLREGYVVYNSGDSYADALDIEGSRVMGKLIGNHVGWVGKSISNALGQWTHDSDVIVEVKG